MKNKLNDISDILSRIYHSIILVDRREIVEMMIERRFGIEIVELPIYTNALDPILIIQNVK